MSYAFHFDVFSFYHRCDVSLLTEGRKCMLINSTIMLLFLPLVLNHLKIPLENMYLEKHKSRTWSFYQRI